MTSLASDSRVAVRALVREPWSSAAIILTLALGLAATTAVYAVFNHLVFRSMPGVRDPKGLVTIVFQPEGKPRTWSSGSAESVALFEAADTGLASVASWSGGPIATPVVVQSGEDPRLFDVEFVPSAYLETLGVRARLGRLLTPQETRERGHGVALVSDVLWHHEFGGTADVLGRAIRVNGQPFTIVGVVEDYRGWGPTAANTADIWLPEPESRLPGAPADSVSLMVGRPRPGLAPSAIQSRLREVYAPLRATLGTRRSDAVPWVYAGLREGPMANGLGVSFSFVIGIAGLLTLLACANAANLLLARTTRRRQDLALRAALGASRWRLMRALVIEAILLATAAVGGGLALTLAITRPFEGVRLFASTAALTGVGIDWRVAAFAAATGAATVLVFALAPITSATRVDLRAVLQEASRSATGSQRVRRALVAVQIALSLVLMASAGVLVRSVWNLRAVDLGMDPRGVFAFTLNPNLIRASGAAADALLARTVERLQNTPGISAVGTANPAAFLGSRVLARLRLETERPEPSPVIETTVVSPDYFTALGVPLLAGRTFVESEVIAAPDAPIHVGLINLSLARALFGDHSAVGRRVGVGSPWGEWKREHVTDIVGVVGDTKTASTLRQPGPAMVLYESTDATFVFSRVYVRSPLPLATVQRRVYEVMRALKPGLPLADAGTLTVEVERLIPEDIAFARLLVTVALVATLLGFAGVYAVTVYSVSERTREFGVRIALGASRAAVIGEAGRGVGVAAIAGSVIGLAAYGVASRLIASRVYGVSPLDPTTLAGAVVLLAVATLIAAWLPARRATRIDPVAALRAE